jgi:hypothetical protein
MKTNAFFMLIAATVNEKFLGREVHTTLALAGPSIPPFSQQREAEDFATCSKTFKVLRLEKDFSGLYCFKETSSSALLGYMNVRYLGQRSFFG